jgi:hypothetical protein
MLSEFGKRRNEIMSFPGSQRARSSLSLPISAMMRQSVLASLIWQAAFRKCIAATTGWSCSSSPRRNARLSILDSLPGARAAGRNERPVCLVVGAFVASMGTSPGTWIRTRLHFNRHWRRFAPFPARGTLPKPEKRGPSAQHNLPGAWPAGGPGGGKSVTVTLRSGRHASRIFIIHIYGRSENHMDFICSTL